MNAYYNELETFPCQVIKTNIAKGRLPHGFVDNRDIREVDAIDIMGHSQYHLFAGIGAAAYACRLAGLPDDFSICTFGFPCQDISAAGKGAGIDGHRSGLFFEAIRLVRVLKPTWLLIENVSALRTRGIERVIEELESAAYCVLPPIVVGADDVGAPHRRKRVWIVCKLANAKHHARSSEQQLESWQRTNEGPKQITMSGRDGTMANAHGRGQQQPQGAEREVGRWAGNSCQELADASGGGFGIDRCPEWQSRYPHQCGEGVANPNHTTSEEQRFCVTDATQFASPRCDSFNRWPSRPGQPQYHWEEPRTTQLQVGRSVDGSARRLARHRRDALKALGNAWCAWTAVPILKWILLMDEQIKRGAGVED